MRPILKRIKNDLIYVFVRLLLFLFRIFPTSLNRLILQAIARTAMILPIRENKIAIKNLQAYFNLEESKKIFKDMYLHWARCIEELIEVHFKGKDIKDFAMISDDLKEVLNRALSEKRGIIYFTAHLGNWELMAMNLAKEGYDTNTIAKESYDPRFTEMIRRFRESNNVKCIFRKEERIIEKIKEVINKNGIMGFLIDQNTKVPSILVNFLNREVPTPVIPVKILKETNAILMVGFNHRINNRIITEVRRLDYSQDEEDRAILERVNAILSEEIMKYPHEWIWVHNRFNISC